MSNPPGIREIFYRCDCGDNDHLISFSYWPEDDEPEVYITMHVWKGGLWSRLKLAVKYVLGISTEYGHWHEIVMTRNNVLGLIDFLRQKHDYIETSGTLGGETFSVQMERVDD